MSIRPAVEAVRARTFLTLDQLEQEQKPREAAPSPDRTMVTLMLRLARAPAGRRDFAAADQMFSAVVPFNANVAAMPSIHWFRPHTRSGRRTSLILPWFEADNYRGFGGL
jgi:hypothetical protein